MSLQATQIPTPPPLPPWVWVEDVILPIAGMALGALVLIGVYKLVVRWLDQRARAAVGADSEVVGQLEQRVQALEHGMLRVQELEERVDFAERLLAQQRPRGGLPGQGA